MQAAFVHQYKLQKIFSKIGKTEGVKTMNI
jgi:hypothetical protein